MERMGTKPLLAILAVLVVVSLRCGESTSPSSPSVPGRLDDARILFLRFSETVSPGNAKAVCTFTMTGDNIERGAVTTPRGERIALTAGDAHDFLEIRFQGTADVLTARFPNGTYTFSAMYLNGFTRFVDRSLEDAFPAFPEILSPLNGVTVGLAPTIEWFTVIDSQRYDVVVFDVACDCEVFTLTVGGTASVMAVAVPEDVLEPATEYRIEVRSFSPQAQKGSASVVVVTTAS